MRHEIARLRLSTRSQLRDNRLLSALMGRFPDQERPVRATRDEALGLSTFGRGVKMIASALASVPLRAYESVPDGQDRPLPDDEQPGVLVAPDPERDVWQFKFAVATDLLEHGNHLSLIMGPDWLMPLPIDQVGLFTDNDGMWQFTFAGFRLDPFLCFHVSAGNRSGEILGRSIVTQHAEGLGVAQTAERWAGRYLTSGALPPAVVNFSGDPSLPERTAFKKRWQQLIDIGGAIIIPAGAQVTPLVSDAEKQQLIETRRWSAEEQARILGIPGYLLGLPVGGFTYANASESYLAFIRDCLTEWADPISAAFNRQLLPPGMLAVWEWASRIKTDFGSQATFVSTLVTTGVLTADEGRAILGYGPKPQEEVAAAPAGPLQIAQQGGM